MNQHSNWSFAKSWNNWCHDANTRVLYICGLHLGVEDYHKYVHGQSSVQYSFGSLSHVWLGDERKELKASSIRSPQALQLAHQDSLAVLTLAKCDLQED